MSGVASVIASVLVFLEGCASVAFLMMLVTGVTIYIIERLTPDALQDWLDSSLTFGHHRDGRFASPVAQRLALQTMTKE
jgi:hypothetical protein